MCRNKFYETVNNSKLIELNLERQYCLNLKNKSMKVFAKTLLAIFCTGIIFTSCTKNDISTPEDGITPAVRQQIAALGFNTNDITKVDEGYLVEGDILLTSENLQGIPTDKELIIAQEEHYRTTNLVSGTRTITVSLSSGAPSYFVTATDIAISRYNALPLRLKFQRVSSGGNIKIVLYYQVSNTLGSAGFPSGGNPYGTIQMNTYWYNSSTNTSYLGSIIAHEMGHCIGFRHTDYMSRQYSCGGSAYNEGSAGVGAIHISGTPTGPSANSWMLACSNGSNRPFTSNDKVALNNVY